MGASPQSPAPAPSQPPPAAGTSSGTGYASGEDWAAAQQRAQALSDAKFGPAPGLGYKGQTGINAPTADLPLAWSRGTARPDQWIQNGTEPAIAPVYQQAINESPGMEAVYSRSPIATLNNSASGFAPNYNVPTPYKQGTPATGQLNPDVMKAVQGFGTYGGTGANAQQPPTLQEIQARYSAGANGFTPPGGSAPGAGAGGPGVPGANLQQMSPQQIQQLQARLTPDQVRQLQTLDAQRVEAAGKVDSLGMVGVRPTDQPFSFKTYQDLARAQQGNQNGGGANSAYTPQAFATAAAAQQGRPAGAPGVQSVSAQPFSKAALGGGSPGGGGPPNGATTPELARLVALLQGGR